MKLRFAQITGSLFGWDWVTVPYGSGILIRKVKWVNGRGFVRPYDCLEEIFPGGKLSNSYKSWKWLAGPNLAPDAGQSDEALGVERKDGEG